MIDITAVKKYITVIERALELLKEAVGGEEPKKDDQKLVRQAHVDSLLAIDCWPKAIPEHLMRVLSDEDQINRANAVLDMLLMKSIENKKFLDFGCGEGWVAREAVKRGAISTGYDIHSFPTWKKFSGVKFTNSLDDSYDVIFIYDVLDHVDDPVGVMKVVNDRLSKDGMIYVRCHPWCSKHASHVYKKGLNKAYIHLFLTWEELTNIGYEPMFTRAEKNPLEAYQWWLKDFNIIKKREMREPVHEFFLVPSFLELVMTEQQVGKGFIEDMAVQFVDFIGEKK